MTEVQTRIFMEKLGKKIIPKPLEVEILIIDIYIFFFCI